MNLNLIFTEGFSNPDTRYLYEENAHIDGRIQCGGCSFYAIFNSDWGLCCHSKSRFYLETVFEHFGCEKNIFEGWDCHSFQENKYLVNSKDHAISLLVRCDKAIGGKRGIGIISQDIRKLCLEIKAFLLSYK
jgi:hypothetical protein